MHEHDRILEQSGGRERSDVEWALGSRRVESSPGE